jgi:hypothetical protein
MWEAAGVLGVKKSLWKVVEEQKGGRNRGRNNNKRLIETQKEKMS